MLAHFIDCQSVSMSVAIAPQWNLHFVSSLSMWLQDCSVKHLDKPQSLSKAQWLSNTMSLTKKQRLRYVLMKHSHTQIMWSLPPKCCNPIFSIYALFLVCMSCSLSVSPGYCNLYTFLFLPKQFVLITLLFSLHDPVLFAHSLKFAIHKWHPGCISLIVFWAFSMQPHIYDCYHAHAHCIQIGQRHRQTDG